MCLRIESKSAFYHMLTTVTVAVWMLCTADALLGNIPMPQQINPRVTSWNDVYVRRSAITSNGIVRVCAYGDDRAESGEGEEEAKILLDKVSKIRAEIAALENKTIAQVEAEAKAKSTAEEERRQAAAELEAARPEGLTRREADGRFLMLPEDSTGQIMLATGAVERAFRDGINRQTVRLALVPEGDQMSEMQEWPGGAKQMLREAAKPLTEALLREIRADAGFLRYSGKHEEVDNAAIVPVATGLPPKIRTQDIWDFDGSAIISAEASSGPDGDVQALVLPNTDSKYTKDIEKIDKAMGARLFLLVNPFWRNLESWGFNIMAPKAKSLAQSVIFDRGYDETYALNRLSVRGETCAALKVYPYDWQLFAYVEDEYFPNIERAVRLGSSEKEPTSTLFRELMDQRPEFKMTKNMRQMQRMMRK